MILALFNIVISVVPTIVFKKLFLRYVRRHWDEVGPALSNINPLRFLGDPEDSSQAITGKPRTAIFLISTSAIFLEESLFRLPLVLLFDSVSILSVSATILSAILFGLYHLRKSSSEPELGKWKYRCQRFSATFLPGLLLGFAALLTGWILVPIALHLLWDVAIHAIIRWKYMHSVRSTSTEHTKQPRCD